MKSFVSPNLTAVSNNINGDGPTYFCQISISPEYQYNRIHYNDFDEFDNFELTKYKIIVEINVTSIKTEYRYVIDGIAYEGSMIEKSKLKDIIEIIVKAYFYIKNDSTKS